MHPALKELADHFGVPLSERSAENGAGFDGKTVAINGKNGYLGDHRLMHEIAHYVVAKKNQKNKPEYNLGSIPDLWIGIRYLHERVVPFEESETQEFMCHFLCVLWGRAYGISPLLASEPDWKIDWDEYLSFKIEEAKSHNEVALQWQALIRLRARGMLRKLPLTHRLGSQEPRPSTAQNESV